MEGSLLKDSRRSAVAQTQSRTVRVNERKPWAKARHAHAEDAQERRKGAKGWQDREIEALPGSR
ncbi:hypothetical protein CKO51_20985 [Rhodopirellula sp. SM50]|nr:hypothetical protein CKO51_20985 [Rhodopirellula sp. SM50]